MISESRTFPATIEGYRDALSFLDGLCSNPRLSIVFDELVSNIVRCAGAREFRIDFAKGEQTRLVISDDGRAFDPTAVPDPDVTLAAEDRLPGGLGLLMVRKLTKSFVYRRAAERNVVEVVI